MQGITHRVAKERTIGSHQEVARGLLAGPELLDRARTRVTVWSRERTVSVVFPVELPSLSITIPA